MHTVCIAIIIIISYIRHARMQSLQGIYLANYDSNQGKEVKFCENSGKSSYLARKHIIITVTLVEV